MKIQARSIFLAIFAGIFLNLIEDLHIPTSERWECGSFILQYDGKLMRKHVSIKGYVDYIGAEVSNVLYIFPNQLYD